MDIIITIPSVISWENYKRELDSVEDESQVINFKVSNLPTKSSVGDRCYLCYKGEIIGWMKIVGFVNDEFDCLTTGKHWKGKFIQRSGKFHKLETPIKMKGFQGYRYFNI